MRTDVGDDEVGRRALPVRLLAMSAGEAWLGWTA
jgi:hypothetical protein